MNLLNGEKGQIYYIKKISLPEKVKRRLEAVGMTEKSTIYVLNKKNNGAVIVKIRGSRFAMGKGFAAGIEIGGDFD